MFTIIQGVPGTGKSLYTVGKIRDEFLPSGRPVFVAGLNVDLEGVQTLDDATKWQECPDGSIIVIDEAADYFPTRSASKQVPEYVQAFRKHRHRGIDLWLAVQDVRDLDVAARRQCTRYLELSRPANGQLLTIREFPRCKYDHENTRQTGVTTWKYDKSLFELYDSAVMHTHKFRLHGKGLLGIVLLVASLSLLGWAGWTFYSDFLGDGGATTPVGAMSNLNEQWAASAAAGGGGVGDAYVERVRAGGRGSGDRRAVSPWVNPDRSFAARIDGEPWTAPAYDSFWSKRGIAPRFPVACALRHGSARTHCKCWDSRFVEIQEISIRKCIAYARHGFPDPRGDSSQRGRGGRSERLADSGPRNPSFSPAGSSVRSEGM